MTTIIIPKTCKTCKHIWYLGDTLEFKDNRLTCKAFPNGIPSVIYYGKNNHMDKIRGDNGITYQAEKKGQS